MNIPSDKFPLPLKPFSAKHFPSLLFPPLRQLPHFFILSPPFHYTTAYPPHTPPSSPSVFPPFPHLIPRLTAPQRFFSLFPLPQKSNFSPSPLNKLITTPLVSPTKTFPTLSLPFSPYLSPTQPSQHHRPQKNTFSTLTYPHFIPTSVFSAPTHTRQELFFSHRPTYPPHDALRDALLFFAKRSPLATHIPPSRRISPHSPFCSIPRTVLALPFTTLRSLLPFPHISTSPLYFSHRLSTSPPSKYLLYSHSPTFYPNFFLSSFRPYGSSPTFSFSPFFHYTTA